MLDFADITPPYEMDGSSWKNAVMGDSEDTAYFKNGRCLFFEDEKDRSVRCGCFKYLEIYAQDAALSSTYQRGVQFQYSVDKENLFDLCGGTDEYNTDPTDNMEKVNYNLTNPEKVSLIHFCLKSIKI